VGHEDGHVAEETDVAAVRLVTDALPLPPELVLFPLEGRKGAGLLPRHPPQGVGVAPLEFLRPLEPGAAALPRFDAAEEGVVLQPPGLFVAPGLEGLGIGLQRLGMVQQRRVDGEGGEALVG